MSEKKLEEIVILCTNLHINQTVGKVQNCCVCNREVWLSDSSFNAIIEQYPEYANGLSGEDAKNEVAKYVRIHCIECGMPKIKKEHAAPARPTDEQMNEAFKWLMKQNSVRDN